MSAIEFKAIIPASNFGNQNESQVSTPLQSVVVIESPTQRVFSSSPTSIFSHLPQREQAILSSIQNKYGLSDEQIADKFSQVRRSANINGRAIPSLVGDCPKEIITLVNDELPRLIGGGDKDRKYTDRLGSYASSGQASKYGSSAARDVAFKYDAAEDRGNDAWRRSQDSSLSTNAQWQAKKEWEQSVFDKLAAEREAKRALQEERDRLVQKKGYTKDDANRETGYKKDDCSLQ